jgi:hypothetical protein
MLRRRCIYLLAQTAVVASVVSSCGGLEVAAIDADGAVDGSPLLDAKGESSLEAALEAAPADDLACPPLPPGPSPAQGSSISGAAVPCLACIRENCRKELFVCRGDCWCDAVVSWVSRCSVTEGGPPGILDRINALKLLERTPEAKGLLACIMGLNPVDGGNGCTDACGGC